MKSRKKLVDAANFIQKILYFLTVPFMIIGVVYEIMGHGGFERAIAKMGINNAFELLWAVFIVWLVLFAITAIIKKKYK